MRRDIIAPKTVGTYMHATRREHARDIEDHRPLPAPQRAGADDRRDAPVPGDRMTKPEPSRPDLLVDEDLDTLYEHAPCGYLSMVPDGTIVKANETLAAWLGVARDSLIGRRFQDL